VWHGLSHGMVVQQLGYKTHKQGLVGLNPSRQSSCYDSGQVAHTPMPLLSSSVILYWPKDGDALWLSI